MSTTLRRRVSDDCEEHEQTHMFVGLDLGKRQDYSALAVVEFRREWRMERNRVTWAMEPREDKAQLTVRQLARIPLGTKYVTVAAKVEKMLRRAGKRWDCTLVVDASGVGQPVVEMFQEAMPRMDRVTIAPAVITGGTGAGVKTRDEWRVSRQDLLGGLQVLLEAEELVISADLEFAPALHEEMLELRGTGSQETGNAAHDDLVIALGLACWRARKMMAAVLQSATRNPRGGEAIYGAGSSPWSWGRQRK